MKATKTRFRAIGLDEAESPRVEKAIKSVQRACPTMTDAAVLRAALRAGLRSFLDAPEVAGRVQAL